MQMHEKKSFLTAELCPLAFQHLVLLLPEKANGQSPLKRGIRWKTLINPIQFGLCTSNRRTFVVHLPLRVIGGALVLALQQNRV